MTNAIEHECINNVALEPNKVDSIEQERKHTLSMLKKEDRGFCNELLTVACTRNWLAKTCTEEQISKLEADIEYIAGCNWGGEEESDTSVTTETHQDGAVQESDVQDGTSEDNEHGGRDDGEELIATCEELAEHPKPRDIHQYPIGTVKNLRASTQWDKMAETFPDNMIATQPVIVEEQRSTGPKYKIVALIAGRAIELTVDSGAFSSFCHIDKARELKMPIFEINNITANTANGRCMFRKAADVMVDFGVFNARVRFLIAEGERFSKDLVLLGSTTIKALKMKADFQNDLVEFDKRFSLRMFTDAKSIQDHIWGMNRDYVSLSETEVRCQHATTIKPGGSEILEIRMPRREANKLNGTYCHKARTRRPLGQ